MTTFVSAQSNPTAVNDLRRWSDDQLVAAAKGGTKAHFGELCERHVKKVFRVVHQIMRNREDAEDAVQDSFLNAFLHLNNFEERSRFVTWLTRIAVNVALTKLRKKRAFREVPIEEPSPSPELGVHWEIRDPSPDPEEAFRLYERKEIVNTAIARLRPGVRDVVEIHQLQGHSLQETGEMLGISTAAVKARMFHARVALRRMQLQKCAGRSIRAERQVVKRNFYDRSNEIRNLILCAIPDGAQRDSLSR